ncbi:hypothetical protein ACFL3B_05170 [Gemmatimonadota bacterium]
MHPDFLVPIAGMATGLILLLPVVRAVVRIAEKKISGRTEGQELLTLREELQMVQERLDGVQYVDDRISEVEERLDFAERLLAQQRDVPRVEGGG